MYIVVRIAEHLGDVVAFGEPVVRQERNPHDLWKDLDVERNGMIMTDGFCEALRAVSLTSDTYHGCFGEITSALADSWAVDAKWNDSQRQWRLKLLEGMQIWHAVFARAVESTSARVSARADEV